MTTHGGGSRMGTKSVSLRERGARASAPRSPRQPRELTSAQRSKLATHGIATTLGVADEKVVVTAALEALNEHLADDSYLRQRIREKYDEIAALSTRSGRKTNASPMPPLIRPAGLNRQTPLHILDPYEVALDYGRDQLRNVLNRATQTNLRVAVGLVQERNPGTKPTDNRTKAGLIDYLVQHVAGNGY